MKVKILLIICISYLYGCVITQEGTINKHINLPENIKKIYVPVFKIGLNVYDPNINYLLTQEIVTQFNLDGSLIVVSKVEEADAIIDGVVKNYIKEAIEFDEQNLPILYRVSIEAEITFRDNKNGQKLWSDNEEKLYAITTYSDRVPPIETEFIAQKRVIEELAIKIVRRAIYGWSDLKKE
ncbi:MAG TPA: LptE family protein [bacterium]|nr:LptE family protein [bacterium]HPQ18558.1 LptE family protein [bacterium]